MKISLYPPLFIHELGQRDNQEDSIIQIDNQLFVLCDGMGGHEHGEVASQTVCQAIGEWYQTKAVLPIDKNQVAEALSYAYEQLDQKDNGELKKMGTTLTFLFIGKNGVIAAHMGDSRIYHIRLDVGILYQSRDHSLVFDLFQAGEITYEEMQNFTQKNVITRVMTPGEDNRMRPDIIQITDIQPDDYFYMCSDGMLEQMSNEELFALLSSNNSDEDKCQQLISATANNQDNHSAWLIHIKEVIREDDDEMLVNEENTSRCNAINILPRVDAANDVEIVDETDVVLVSTPKPPKRKLPWIKIVVAFAALLLTLFIVCFLFIRNNKNETLVQPKPIMQIPIGRDSNKIKVKDSIIKDSCIVNKYDSANKQPVNAPSWSDSSRYIQNR